MASYSYLKVANHKTICRKLGLKTTNADFFSFDEERQPIHELPLAIFILVQFRVTRQVYAISISNFDPPSRVFEALITTLQGAKTKGNKGLSSNSRNIWLLAKSCMP
jgi:hypothetical protein